MDAELQSFECAMQAGRRVYMTAHPGAGKLGVTQLKLCFPKTF